MEGYMTNVNDWLITMCKDYKYSEQEVLEQIIIDYPMVENTNNLEQALHKLDLNFKKEQDFRDWIWDNVYIMSDRIN
jgi:hypothetical protein